MSGNFKAGGFPDRRRGSWFCGNATASNKCGALLDSTVNPTK
jgi:hypothetical protein